MYATVKAIWLHFFRVLTSSNELQVWQKIDRKGNRFWQAHEPKTDKYTSLGSEAEMRIWSEQSYYTNYIFSYYYALAW